MGCISSKKELRDINPNMYRVSNVDDDGIALWSGQLSISRTELTLYRKNKEPTQWPLKCLRRYGYEADLFTFEAGRRCTTGEGIYAFRCRRAESLFQTLQSYIQIPATLEDNMNQMDAYPMPIVTNGPAVTPRNRASTQSSMVSNNVSTSSGTAITCGGSAYAPTRPMSQNLSPSGTIQSNSNRSRSTDTLNGDGNYLEPTPSRPTMATRFHSGLRLGSVSSGGPMSPDPHSPGSPNSITNILEVTTLNPLPIANPGISNLYQEFPLREHNNNIHLNNNHHKKLSLDIPPQEPAPSLNLSSLKTQSAVISNNEFTDDLQHRMCSAVSGSVAAAPLSPISSNMINSDSFDSAHMYMNITPGEMQSTVQKQYSSQSTGGSGGDTPQIAQTPTTNVSMFGMSRMNSTFSVDPNRLYENLGSGEIRPLLARNNRFSKPDIFAKVDLPSAEKSEPTTPTIHYIVLDLDHSPANNNINNINNNNSGLSLTSSPQQQQQHTTNINLTMPTIVGPSSLGQTSINVSNSIGTISTGTSSGTLTSAATTPSMSAMTLLPPESPKKGVMDYAKIDFNKTVALSNSTTPSSELDSEGSRKTRHSSVATKSPNISGE